MKMNAYRALIVALFVWALLLTQPNAPTSSHQPQAAQAQPAAPTKDRITHRSARADRKTRDVRISQIYPKDEIQSRLRNSRLKFASCLGQDQELKATRVQMKLEWSGEGRLSQVQLVPKPALEAVLCIEKVVKNWDLPPHPGLQTFSYNAWLVPSR